MTTSKRIALIGSGTMGGNHARVVAESSRAELAIVVDRAADRAEAVARRYGAIGKTILPKEGYDAAIVASPTDSHLEVGLDLIERGVPVLIEKPVSNRFTEVQTLCETASRTNVPLSCGFVERFNPVLDTARTILESVPIHIVTMRHSPPTPRVADSVIYDLLIHDIDIARRLMSGTPVVQVSAGCWSGDHDGIADIADCTIVFEGGAIATLSASRVGQRKLRSVQVFCASMLADIDLLRADVTIFRNVSQEQSNFPIAPTYRADTIVDIPFVRHSGEPLARQFNHFLDLIQGDADASAELHEILASHEIAAKVDQACRPGGTG